MSYDKRVDEPVNELLNDLMQLGLRTALRHVALATDVPEVARMARAVTHLSVRELADRARRSDRVEVTTMTSSKGLEFDTVLLVGADEQSIPSYQSATVAELAEERRKFYVSITRARDELQIFYSGFVLTRWGRRVDAGPSRYLEEIELV